MLFDPISDPSSICIPPEKDNANIFTKTRKDKNTYHWKPDNIKYLPKVIIIEQKSVRKYSSAKGSHHIEISQSIYNINKISGYDTSP